VLASSSPLVGGLLALRVSIPTGVLGLIMAFGAGVSISAVAYELVQEAFETSAGSGGVALGLALGSLAFFMGDLVIDRMGGAERKRSQASQPGGAALAIADTMMPEAFDHGGRYVGLATTAGFGLAFAITALE
jgi:zinc transporter, ZIP family